MKNELSHFPATGRFLLGRGRERMGSEALDAFECLFTGFRQVASGDAVVRAYAASQTICIMVSGFAVRTLTDGPFRTIVGVVVPGDLVDRGAMGSGMLDHDVVALGPVTVACAERNAVERVAAGNVHVTRALWAAEQFESAMQRQWIAMLGRLKAPRRVARLLSELWFRLDMIGLASDRQFAIPVTQQDLADMCGTTAIHMNRALGELRRDGLAEVRRGVVTVPDRAALERYGAFKARYLSDPRLAAADVTCAAEYHIVM